MVSYSGALEPAAAQDLNDYHLASAGKDRKFGTRDDRKVTLTAPLYDPALRTVTLTPRRSVPAQALQLTINAAGTLDAQGRPIDGDRDHQPGGDFHAIFKGNGISFSRVFADGLPAIRPRRRP